MNKTNKELTYQDLIRLLSLEALNYFNSGNIPTELDNETVEVTALN